MEKLLEILNTLRPNVDFSNHTKLIEDDILDSFDIVTIVGEINFQFDVEIGVEDLLPENFNSAEAMMALISRLQND